MEVSGVVGVSIKMKLLRLKDNVRWVTVAVGLVGLFLITVIAEWVRFRFRFRGIVLWIGSRCQESRFGSLRGHAFRSEQQFLLS